MSLYASFQGRVFLGERDSNGLPINLYLPGNVAALNLALNTELIEHYESQSGQRSLDLRMIKQKSATVNMTIEEFLPDNLALALYGNKVVGTTGTVTAESIGGATPTAGQRVLLANQKVTNLVLTDSAGTPATLTLNTHYTADVNFGTVTFVNLASFTPPIKAAYSYGAVTNVGIFTQPLPERFVRMEGVNTAASNARVIVELYRVAFDPLKELGLISDDLAKFELEGSLLADSSKAVDALLGQYGRIIQL